MHLQLGPHRFDVAHRALVVAALEGTESSLPGAAAVAEAEGADLLSLPPTTAKPGTAEALDQIVRSVEALVPRVALPVAVVTSHAGEAEAAFAAGAVVAHDPSGLADPAYADAVVAAGAAVVVVGASTQSGEHEELDGLAGHLEEVGVDPTSIVLDAGFDRAEGHFARRLLATSQQLADDGFRVQLSVGLGGDAGLAAVSMAISLGCRLIRTSEVAATRRARDVLAAVLEAR